ncbi:hypothetical protein NIES4102_29800 [Chondrocystis sp. NIES-4102]|nr:hypothetical protein NIES4102_29800 [Chondrocystis sp. NIES-4102]
MNPKLIKNNIAQALAVMDEQKIEKYAHDLKLLILNKDDDFELYFIVLLELLNQPDFAEISLAWNYFKILKSCQYLLSQSQKTRFFTTIASAYKAFEETNPYDLQNAIQQAITLNDSIIIEKHILELDSCFFGLEHFPEDIFSFLISLFTQDNVLNMNGSWHLLMPLQYNWELLSDEQKKQLILTLESVYIKLQDWMSLFIISEILGENFANEQAFDVLCKFKNIESVQHRSFVPHGFEHIVRDSPNKKLAEKAYFELLQMKEDSSPIVRDEVTLSIKRITRNRDFLKCGYQ